MSWLTARIGKRTSAGNVPSPATCDHPALSPRWRDPAAMGEPGQPMGYLCHRCHAEFLPYQVLDGEVIEVR